MLIMGVDPGIAISGYGIISNEQSNCYVVEYGVIRTPPKLAMPYRLKQIHEGYIELIQKYKPDVVAVEELFFNKNAKTIISVGQARGVAVLAAALSKIEVFEYTPLQVKQAVVGYGRADKQQVQQMIKTSFNLEELPKPDDAADALAVALCHMNSYKLRNIMDGRGF
ncbi:component of RuvABC resolvasome, endonuclease [Tepidanaerobacter acetatoxydans Re1]|uniref:Crossover junction endodeoxyribonuclease RuvC n=1 Tax=Tepidanaerobacter acetatoxydans (strain DSM 21804 / JCM 16047 / Re1) TaxID=1209989 RepID=F4LT49_TEPAE|nr:crossover junction endodeoxyribonuclease RuvC [Tepidanaerobacter acetatoxydans]AEE91318.1 Crossover junction endodeoxyribonuclease ruvC [Tepidanaerobacter acetatoxydans Re1]CCP26006.1 component of RuvABC resolvasome, endonuclease [Tepidanaerobacter acetatoxydans Re1]